MSAGVTVDRGQLDMSAVPAHIRERAERANRALAAQREGRDPNEALAGHEPQEARQEPQEARQEPEAPQEPRQEQQPQEARQEARQEPVQEPPKEDATWEQRFRSLEGQLRVVNQQHKELQTENQQLRAAARELENRLIEQGQQMLQLPVAGAGNPELQAKLDVQSLFTEQEKAEYGPELFNMFGRVADALQDELAKVRGQTQTLAQRNEMSDRQRMHTTLNERVPDWQSINNDPKFKEFILQADEGSGQLRKVLLQNAYNSNQTNRVLYFFERFLQETGRAAPEAQQGQAVEGRATAPRSKSLTDIAAPGKAKQGQAPLPSADPAGPTRYNLKDITEFSRLKALGRLNMTPEQIAAKTLEFDKAYSEGRINI